MRFFVRLMQMQEMTKILMEELGCVCGRERHGRPLGSVSGSVVGDSASDLMNLVDSVCSVFSNGLIGVGVLALLRRLVVFAG